MNHRGAAFTSSPGARRADSATRHAAPVRPSAVSHNCRAAASFCLKLRNGNRNRVALQLEHSVRRKVASGNRVFCRSGTQRRQRSACGVMGQECFHDLLDPILLPLQTAGLQIRSGVTRTSRVVDQLDARGRAASSQLKRDIKSPSFDLATRGPGSVGTFPLQIAES